MTGRKLPDQIVLSVCVRCRDGREDDNGGRRGGARFASAVADALGREREKLPAFEARGVRCMSQCKRACTVSLTAPGAFTWLFGDLDPERHAEDILALLRLYAQSPGGFMARDARPEPMRAGVLGRLPPIGSSHEVIEPLVTPPNGWGSKPP
ncbi:MAG: DUF1636 domain-containing protein [Pseudomonadota bacterium]